MRKLSFLTLLFLGALNLNAQIAMTLEKAFEIASVNSPDIRTSMMNLDRAKLNLLAQRAALKSRFSLDLNPISYSKNRSFDSRLSKWYTNESFSTMGTFRVSQPIVWTDGTLSLVNSFGWQDNKSELSNGTNENKAFQNNLYLSLSQPIFTYNRSKMNLKQLELDLENAMLSYALQQLSLERNITSSFYNVYMAQSNLTITEDAYKSALQSYEIIKNKVEADLSAKDELFQAELNLSTALSSVEDAKVTLDNSKDQLKQRLGIPLDEDFSVFTEVNVEKVNFSLGSAVDNAMNSRLELRQREITTEQLEFQMIQTKALNEFKGDINLSIGIMGENEAFGNIYEHPTQNPRVAVSFSVPIFDWGERKARIKAQETAMKINSLQTEEEVKSIEMDIRQTYRSLENDYRQIEIAKQSVTNAQLTYDLNLERYRNGDLSGMEMSQFENQLSSKKISLVQAMINYKIDLLNMKILTLYDFDANRTIMPEINEMLGR